MLIKTDITRIGDPFILRADGCYYMYATGFDVVGFKVWKSNDLRDWECVGVCLDLNGSWAKAMFWAPEVVFHNGKYIMHFTASTAITEALRIGVAVSDSPEGPFVLVRNAPMFDLGYGVLDPSAFIDDDGQAYLYYSRASADNTVNGLRTATLCVVKLDDSLTKVTSEPVEIATPTFDYERIATEIGVLNEGPFVLKHDGKYYLTYSANSYNTEDYCICLATSNKPMGEFVKNANNPILKGHAFGSDITGPGHNAFFIDADGKLKIVFHVQTNNSAPSSDRRAAIADAEFAGDTIKIIF